MTAKRLLLLAAASVLAAGGLSGCASNFKADVARFHEQLPPPAQGQSFTIQADDPQLAGGLEFRHYGELVAQRLVGLGYKESGDPASAQLVVRLDYGVDKGTQRIRSSPGFGRGAFYDPFYGPYAGRGRFMMYGFYDPFLWGPGFGGGPDIDSYTVYQSELKMKIDRTGGGRVFEGTAKAQSLSNKLTYLVPNLVDALFTGFPGKDGEEVKITLAPEPKSKSK